MKAKHFTNMQKTSMGRGRSARRRGEGVSLGMALLGVACVTGMFVLLTLLYQVG